MVKKKIKGVLLVDDDSINNYINARLINKIDFTDNLAVSLNGQEAITYLNKLVSENKDCPSLILLDINMPVMDGFEFLDYFQKLIFKNSKEVVIAMLSTSENFRDIEKVNANTKISCFLNKPLTEEKILKLLDKHF